MSKYQEGDRVLVNTTDFRRERDGSIKIVPSLVNEPAVVTEVHVMYGYWCVFDRGAKTSTDDDSAYVNASYEERRLYPTWFKDKDLTQGSHARIR